MVNFLDVSIWILLISAGVNMIGGMLWYGPLFGGPWMRGMGVDPKNKEQIQQLQKGAGVGYAFSLIFAIIFGYAVDLLISNLAITNLFVAIALTFIVYLGFSLSNTIKGLLWGETNKNVFIINTGFELAFTLIVAVAAFYL